MAANGTTNLVKEYWFIILAIITIVTSYTTLGVKLSNCENDLDQHCEVEEKHKAALIECQAEIREMRIDMSYLKASANRVEAATTELLKELRRQ